MKPMSDNIKEHNILIAKFMGAKHQVFSDGTVGVSFWYTPLVEGKQLTFPDGGSNYYDFTKGYNTSWDWIMDAVNKIESLRDVNGDAYRFTIDMCNAEIENTPIKVLGGLYKIDAVYQAVVEFIKWYNKILY